MKIRNTALASAAAILASAGSAWAADPVVYEQAPEPVVAISAYDWSGVYIGIQGGYGWADLDVDFTDAVVFEDETFDLDGGFAGVYAGYNWQWNSLVLGVEGDINKSWIGDDIDVFDGDVSTDAGEVEIDWFGSIRGRVGYAWNRTMIFGTAGFAYANLDFEADDDFEGLFQGSPDELDDDEDFTGWTVGAGIEHAFTDNWLARAEYRYYDFGDGSFQEGTRAEMDLELEMHTVSVGIAYKF